MTPPVVDHSTSDTIEASHINDIKDYIEDGTYRVNTSALEINKVGVIDSSRNITLSNINNVETTITNDDTKFPTSGAVVDYAVSKASSNQGDILYDDGTSIVRLNPGTSGQYLKTQGSGANPIWATVSSGSSPTIFEATVGASGADYTTLGAAITAGKSRLLVIDNTTETADISMPNDFLVKGIGRYLVNVDMAGYKFTQSGTSNCHFESIEITHTASVFTDIAGLVIDDCLIDNNSTVTSSYLANYNYTSGDCAITNTIFELPNKEFCGLQILPNTTESNKNSFISNCTFIGGGTNTYRGLKIGVPMNNCVFTGTFSTTIEGLILDRTIATNLFIFRSNFIIDLQNGGSVVSNIKTGRSITNGKIQVATNDCSISNIRGINVQFESGSDNSVLSNATELTTLTLDTGGDNIKVSNCIVEGSITVNGAMGNFNNTIFTGGVTVVGNNNSFTGCTAGAIAGGGSNTITVNSGASNTIIVGNRTDATISDSGTGTVTVGNIVY